MSSMKVQEYIKEDGSSPYQEWFDSLDSQSAAKVTVAKSRLELQQFEIKRGTKMVNFKDVKKRK